MLVFPSFISRSFPDYPTFFSSFLEFAAFSLSRILASLSWPPPFPASFSLASFPFSSICHSFGQTLASLPSFQQSLTLFPYIAGLDPTFRVYLLALLKELHAPDPYVSSSGCAYRKSSRRELRMYGMSVREAKSGLGQRARG